MSIKVLLPGALTTVQDLGRFGYQQFGIPCSVVMDQASYRDANYLLNNQKGEAVLEFTLFGGSYQFDADTVIALTGADMHPQIDGIPCPMNQPVSVGSGSVLTMGLAASGCRTYLAVDGGIDVPEVLQSRSTNLKCKFGGFQGRALQKGDLIPTKRTTVDFASIADRTTAPRDYPRHLTLRVIEGPQADAFTIEGQKTFYASLYTIAAESDRMGCRLEGPMIESHHGTDIISDGIVFGSVQITSAGKPIILLADRQTTGGYAKIATVCSADLPLLAQALPGNTIRFQKISVEQEQNFL